MNTAQSKNQFKKRTSDMDYEEKSHTQTQKKAAIRTAFVKKSKEEKADTYGFDDYEDISQYERFIK